MDGETRINKVKSWRSCVCEGKSQICIFMATRRLSVNYSPFHIPCGLMYAHRDVWREPVHAGQAGFKTAQIGE